MVRTIVREHHWPPESFGGLFIDAEDHEGMTYWYNDIKEMHQEAKKKKPK